MNSRVLEAQTDGLSAAGRSARWVRTRISSLMTRFLQRRRVEALMIRDMKEA